MTASPQWKPPRNNDLFGDNDPDEFEFGTHPGRPRLELVNTQEPWLDDSELSDEILVRLWLARQRALARAFPTRT